MPVRELVRLPVSASAVAEVVRELVVAGGDAATSFTMDVEASDTGVLEAGGRIDVENVVGLEDC